MRISIDADIQQAVADDFCKMLDEGGNIFELSAWCIREMERRQDERNKAILILEGESR